MDYIRGRGNGIATDGGKEEREIEKDDKRNWKKGMERGVGREGDSGGRRGGNARKEGRKTRQDEVGEKGRGEGREQKMAEDG